MTNRLVIGTKRYSSWSLRGWLAVRLAGLNVTEQVVPLGGGGQTHVLREISPNGLVPYLDHDGAEIWESLAICEYCAEIAPSLWPEGRIARARARSIAAQMHAGFAALRRALPMNEGRVGRARASGLDASVQADIVAVVALWDRCLAQSGGPFLFGATFTIPDIMFAPVVCRFHSYAIELAPEIAAYRDAVLAHPLMRLWHEDAMAEPEEWLLDGYESLD